MARFPIGIEHVVVLCLENRSFDHMLGFLGTPNGLTGDELNLTDPEDPSSTPVKVSKSIYDHVLPPPTVNPDGKWSHDPEFGFEQLGLRVPAVLVSPRIAKGTVDGAAYDHTSLLATVKEMFGLKKFLTERDARAKTFTHLFGQAPRADAPTKIARPAGPGDLPPSVAAAFDAGFGAAGEAPSEFQVSLLDFADSLPAPVGPSARALGLARSIDEEYAGAIDRVSRFLKS
jgi:hypothetical protein